MSIRQSFNNRVNQMTLGEVGTYGVGMFTGEITGLVAGVEAIHSMNDSSAYQTLQDRIIQLSHENTLISGVTEHNLLHGYSGKVATEAFLGHRIDANSTKIKALQAQQPEQIGDVAVLGLFVGIGFAGAVAGTALAYSTRKAVIAARSKLRKPEENPTSVN